MALAAASFEWCGLHGCHWDDRGSPVRVGVLTLLAGAMVAAPWWFVRWTARPRLRVIVGLALWLVVWIGGWHWVTHPGL